jgi:hypothetical protein
MFTLSLCSAILMFISGFGSVYDLKVLLLSTATNEKNLNCSSKNIYS